MRRRRAQAPWLALALFTGGGAARAVTLFPAGAESKTAGMESALKAKGAPSVLYNPANLAAEGQAAPYAELGLINVNYSYEHPEFDPVNVVVTSPTATFGYAQPVHPRVTVGAVIFPSASGKTTVPGLPRKVDNSMLAVTAEAEDKVFDLGIGAAYSVGSHVAIGLGLVRTHEEHKVRAEVPGSVQPVVDMDYKNDFNRPVAGVTLLPLSGVGGAVAYRPAQAKSYRGSTRRSVGDFDGDPKVTGFEPETISLGLKAALGRMVLAAEAQRQKWSAGRTVVKNGIDQDRPEADLHDVVQMSVSGGYHPTDSHGVDVGYARLPTPWGDGRDTGELSDHVFGVDFGQLNGIDLRVMSVGGQLDLLGGELTLAVYHARGEREVLDDGDNVGYYSLGITSVSGGFRRPF